MQNCLFNCVNIGRIDAVNKFICVNRLDFRMKNCNLFSRQDDLKVLIVLCGNFMSNKFSCMCTIHFLLGNSEIECNQVFAFSID